MCGHLSDLLSLRSSPVTPSALGCEECLESGDAWVHLRLCMTCGHVGCCDDSKNRHATSHFETLGHPVVKSFEPGEDWAWCYVDDELVERIPAFPIESPPEHLAAITRR
ncbi:UBP-type zinc finger domain-containing protein [Anaeromyxobacter sp. Fw109-5]|uniref:UBP-type zinc finger domain-containing protein n=1 Tax=Anaeromyxobacter sp. (strain Fw109-5) TaxID=404589 RepID=UPI0000ED800A|nr:UBP-type zinc finger domain-containing protein [Anaeromyxobacter sp. Fw109-5]ABS25246.1 zinc finger, UBP-type [Anaeromyxobacter sp. Fw109-5]